VGVVVHAPTVATRVGHPKGMLNKQQHRQHVHLGLLGPLLVNGMESVVHQCLYKIPAHAQNKPDGVLVCFDVEDGVMWGGPTGSLKLEGS